MKTIDDFHFDNKKALIRVDFNVPLDDNHRINDPERIDAALPTIRKILNDGGKVILMSHLGRPGSFYEKKYSLIHLLDYLRDALKTPVHFAEDCIGKPVSEKIAGLNKKEVLLLENLRFHPEESKGDREFAKKLSAWGEIYVNDAFGTAHRAHASTAIIAEFFPENKCFGYLMRDEINNIDRVLQKATAPFTAVIGGAKVSDKVLILENLINKVDNLLIGGAMAYTFWAAQNGKTGKSLVEKDSFSLASTLMEKAKKEGVRLLLPQDSRVADNFSNDAQSRVSLSYEIEDDWMGLDIGPAAIEAFSEVIRISSTILWNGPMGVFEFEQFRQGTLQVAKSIAESTQKGAFSLIGGGDSVSAVKQFGYSDQVSYVSTGGGAMLEYLEGKILPGIKAILE
jgi:phosphoglycerate kinase